MEALLRNSKGVCPFLKKSSVATLRSLSTSTAAHNASPGGGSMSNLQAIARRCPIMAPAMSLQSAKLGRAGMSGVHGLRASHSKAGKVNMHTSSAQKAQAVDIEMLRREPGTFSLFNGCSQTFSV